MPVSEDLAVSQLIGEIKVARTQSDQLFSIIKQSAIYDRPIDARHRVIFYIGHLDGFDFIQICREKLGIGSFDPTLDNLFQAGIDPDSGNLPSDTPADWPSLGQIDEYVQKCRKAVDKYLEQAPSEIVNIALEHRLMHLETLAYMFHNFGYDTKVSSFIQSLSTSTEQPASQNAWCNVPAGIAILGKKQDESFGWDNEYEQVHRPVPAFHIQKYSVTNGDYLKFVKQGASAPHFWAERNGAFFCRGMFQEFPLPLDWPVYVTQAQAEDYAKWIGKALPSEEQFHRAAYGTPSGKTQKYPWGSSAPTPLLGNFNFRRWDPESVLTTPAGDSAFGVSQLLGNGWEWTNTPFGPLPEFKPYDTYPGYSANFFDGEHFVLKGGSSRTSSLLLRPSFRNWFRRDYPYMYAKFRCVESLGE